MSAKIKEKLDFSIEGKLRGLFHLQQIDTKIDKLRTIRGELPLEVSDLEDTVTGLETRLNNLTAEVQELEQQLNEKKQSIKDFVEAQREFTKQVNRTTNEVAELSTVAFKEVVEKASKAVKV